MVKFGVTRCDTGGYRLGGGVPRGGLEGIKDLEGEVGWRRLEEGKKGKEEGGMSWIKWAKKERKGDLGREGRGG